MREAAPVDDALDQGRGERGRADRLLHDEGGGQALDAGQAGELLVAELLVGGEVEP
ncbi:hypothetical protein [Streptomyces sp. NPDC093984]|uniref:hypothetical protein n=1 Tax=Streptomyces sp. NPDC093984 TaxID=3366052 RepID=UPI0038256818